jgi:hypothetical protein
MRLAAELGIARPAPTAHLQQHVVGFDVAAARTRTGQTCEQARINVANIRRGGAAPRGGLAIPDKDAPVDERSRLLVEFLQRRSNLWVDIRRWRGLVM